LQTRLPGRIRAARFFAGSPAEESPSTTDLQLRGIILLRGLHLEWTAQ
jgi:hypothetical protein